MHCSLQPILASMFFRLQPSGSSRGLEAPPQDGHILCGFLAWKLLDVDSNPDQIVQLKLLQRATAVATFPHPNLPGQFAGRRRLRVDTDFGHSGDFVAFKGVPMSMSCEPQTMLTGSINFDPRHCPDVTTLAILGHA